MAVWSWVRTFPGLMKIYIVCSLRTGIGESLLIAPRIQRYHSKSWLRYVTEDSFFCVTLWIGRLWQNYIHVTWIHLLSSFTCFLTCLENDILRFSLALTRCDFLMEDTSAGLQFKANKPMKLRKAIALLQMVAMSWKTH